MQRLAEGMLLYHGSFCEVKVPDLAKCASYKDFGTGFYLTSSKQQAENFINTSLKKAKSQGIILDDQHYGFVSVFKFVPRHPLSTYEFRDADVDWLHCIVGHRRANTFPGVVADMAKYDVITGKIADDATNFTIVAYLAGTYGTMGSPEADVFCISRLLPDRLKDQYCFRTQDAIDSLEFIGSERIWKN